MLRSFRVANHRSIRAEAELLLMPAYDKERPVVPVAAIFGANASGKSNLLDALRFMQTAVRTSYAEGEPGSGVPRTPFRLDPAAADEPSAYVVELLLNGVRHVYGFEVDDRRVREEWLYAYPHSRRRVIFDRDADEIKFGSTGATRRYSATVASLARPDALFISVAARSNVDEVQPVYQWFRKNLTCGLVDSLDRYDPLIRRWQAEGAQRRLVLDLIRAADLGIADVQVVHELVEVDLLADGRRRTKMRPVLQFVQGLHGAVLRLSDQSAGTRAWLSLLGPALDCLEIGGTLLVDEIDSSLHPRLAARLIELFQAGETNPRGAQLVFTTHDATLLGPVLGDDTLARDQIWFVEKDATGATSLFPLTDFRPRKEENTERRYLAGSYGAVPETSQYAFARALTDAGLGAVAEGGRRAGTA
jgi:hypothetical protein